MAKLNWKQVEGTQAEEPSELEAGRTTVYLRRNIEQTEKEDADGNAITVWSYEEAKLTIEEYAEYVADTEAPSVQLMMQQISGIQSEQELAGIDRTESTETIMQALSDIQADIALLG